jgi:hypothetical protein
LWLCAIEVGVGLLAQIYTVSSARIRLDWLCSLCVCILGVRIYFIFIVLVFTVAVSFVGSGDQIRRVRKLMANTDVLAVAGVSLALYCIVALIGLFCFMEIWSQHWPIPNKGGSSMEMNVI